MPGIVLWGGVGVFLVCLALHLVVWNVVSIKKEIFAVVALFAGGPLLFWLAVMAGVEGMRFEAAAAGLLTLSLSAAYLQTYPVLRVRIPTFRIILLIHEAGGLTAEEVTASLADDRELFPDKITELENDALVTSRDGKLRLTAAGRLVAWFFEGYRKTFGMAPGRG